MMMMAPKFPLQTFEDVLEVLVTVPVEYEVRHAGRIRCVEPCGSGDAAGCPLNVIAEAYGRQDWAIVANDDTTRRVWIAADNVRDASPDTFDADRALLLQACGLT
jgi:hypothetical protein